MASSTDNTETPYYGYNQSASDAKGDKENWSAVEDNVGSPEEVREREKLDDAAFESQTHMPGASDPNTKEEDKSLVQKAIDTVSGLNDEASTQYLAS